mgnify:CR=1 FL=1
MPRPLPTDTIATVKATVSALAAETRAAAERHGDMQVEIFHETADGLAHAGRISMDWLRTNTPLAEADIHLCGPRPFLRHFVQGLHEARVSADRIRYGFFGTADEPLAA